MQAFYHEATKLHPGHLNLSVCLGVLSNGIPGLLPTLLRGHSHKYSEKLRIQFQESNLGLPHGKHVIQSFGLSLHQPPYPILQLCSINQVTNSLLCLSCSCLKNEDNNIGGFLTGFGEGLKELTHKDRQR